MTTTITPFEIPLSPEAQRFAIQLAQVNYNLLISWNVPANCWVMDINDADNNPLLLGIPLITGHNLLEQFDYVGIGGGFICQTDADPDAVPTFENLGDSGHLYFVGVT